MLNQVQHDIFSMRHPERYASLYAPATKKVSGSHSKKTPQGDKKSNLGVFPFLLKLVKCLSFA